MKNIFNTFLNKANGVIFDVDGIIIDSEPIWDKAHPLFLSKFGVKSSRSAHNTMGMGMQEAMQIFKEEYQLSASIEELTNEARNSVYELLFSSNNLVPMDGVLEMIEMLSGKKKLGIATGGHSVLIMEKILATLKINSHFLAIASCDDVTREKPFPDVFLLATKKLGISPEDCLVFEDSPNGVTAAKAAGMITIAINKDKVLQKELQKAGADVVVGSFTNLL
ncbi:MAG: HAD family hydrolase [Candidatus Levyibacteriota bacterium]